MENIKFILVCLAIFAGLFLLALGFEKLLVKHRKKFCDTHYITYTAILSAVAGVLMLFEIPLFFAPSFYKLDLSELPVLICTFYLGPVAGVVSELLKVTIKLILKGTTTAFVGDFANFAVVPFNLLKGVVVSLLTMLLYKRISPLLHMGDDKKKERKAHK